MCYNPSAVRSRDSRVVGAKGIRQRVTEQDVWHPPLVSVCTHGRTQHTHVHTCAHAHMCAHAHHIYTHAHMRAHTHVHSAQVHKLLPLSKWCSNLRTLYLAVRLHCHRL